MRSVLLILLVSLAQVHVSSSCPASCVVCSEDAIICNKLSAIIEVPDSAKALMLTDGLIDTVGSVVFSESSNLSVLALSNNLISTILDKAFQNLTILRTLILDHNRISNQALDTVTFSWLRKLETLHLGNNALRDIDGSWFQGTKALKTLLLKGNLLTSLNSSTFASSDLRNLEVLDLSDNLIAYLGRNSFRNLPQLRSLDLSRNKLENAPDAFSYLSSLSVLNLDLNRWNCTCTLRELALFLNSYIQSPGNVLYNGQKMECVSFNNPAVKTVLELTDANCAPANSNITVTVVSKCPVTPQHYIRDVTITAACSFLGGVGITLGVLALVYRKLGKRFRCVQEKNEAEDQSSQASARWEYTEGKEALSMAYSLHNSNHRPHQPWSKESASYDIRSVENHFICHNCSSAHLETADQEGGRRETVLHRVNQIGVQHKREEGWSTPVDSDQWKECETHSVLQSRIKDIRAQRHTEKINGSVNNHHLRGQDNGPQSGVSTDLSTLSMQQLALRRHISVSQRQTFTPQEQMHQKTLGNHKNNPSELQGCGALPLYQTINCLHCHQTYEYRQTGNGNQDHLLKDHKENIWPSEEKTSEAILYRDSLNYKQTSAESQAREQRSVTFDLSRPSEQAVVVCGKDHEGPYRISKTKTSHTPLELDPKWVKSFKLGKTSGKISSTHKHKPGSQLNRKLKVKINLNPLRRNRIQSTSSHSHEDYDTNETSTKGKNDKIKAKKDYSKSKSKKNKTPRSGSKALKGSKHSENEKEDETATIEEDNDNTSSKIKPGPNEDNTDVNKVISTDLQSDGQIQAGSNLLSLDTNATTSENQILQNSAVPLTHSLDLSAAVTTLEDISGPQEDPTVTQETGEYPETPTSTAPPVVQEYLSSDDGSPKRRIRLIIPEKTSNRPQTALEKKIR